MEIALRVGDVLRERYEIQEPGRLGDGKTVYIAHDRRSDRKVVVDVFHSNDPVMGGDRAVGAWEVYVLRHLGNHPNINALIEDWEEDKTATMVCYHLPCGTLQDRIAKAQETGERLPCEMILKISTEIGRALKYVHERGFLHRDLQPRNVRFDAEGAVRLVDFDTAVRLGGTAMSDMSRRLVIDYMAPEMVEGGAADQRADLYSLGATVYEMIAGRPPFAGVREQILAAKRVGAPPALERNDIPEVLRDLVLGLLAPEPCQRPPSAAEVVERLESLGDARADIEQLLTSCESDSLEFKSTLRVSVGRPAPESAIERSVLKTLAALLNTHGGHLIIGVAEGRALEEIADDSGIVRIAPDRAIVGIERDYGRTRGSSDGWDRTFGEVVSNALGKAAMNCIRVQLQPWSGLTIAVIRCFRRDEPTWLGDELFIRRTATSVKLETMKEAVDWARERWGPTLIGPAEVPAARRPGKVEPLPSFGSGGLR